MILCGGMGTRIRDVTDAVPKPLIDVGGRPILWHIMKTYDHFGFRRFVLCLGYRSFDIKQYFLRYRENLADFTLHLKGDHDAVFRNEVGNEDWEVTCVETGLNTATGGRVGRVPDYVDTSTVHAHLRRRHRQRRHRCVARAPSRARPDRDGDRRASHVALRRDAASTGRWSPSSTRSRASPDGFVSGGFFVFEDAFFDYLSEDEGLFLEQEPLRTLAQDAQLAVYAHEGFWCGMDTYREYTLLNDLWNRGEAPWKTWRD